MRINTNLVALNVFNAMKKTDFRYAQSAERLSTGRRINSAKDDAAGLAIANKLQADKQKLYKASNNATDGVSLIQTVDGALSSVNDMLQKMRTLAVQSSNDTLTDTDREKIQKEINQLKTEIDSLSERAEFNGIKVLAGDASRITYNRNAGDVNVDNVSDINYVSGKVPEGSLEFTVEEIGTSAVIDFDSTSIPSPVPAGSVTINGSSITFDGTESDAEAISKIQELCERNNLEMFDGKIVSREQGSDQVIEVTTQPAGQYGFTGTTTSQGTDAVISDLDMYKLYDTEAFDDAVTAGADGLTSFNQSSNVRVEGNRVYVQSSNGQEIEIDLNVKLDGDGNYAVDGDTYTSTPNGNVAVDYSERHEILNAGQIKIQVGSKKDQEIDIYGRKITCKDLGIEHLNVSTRREAEAAISEIDKALGAISDQRTIYGAYQNRLDYSEKMISSQTLSTEKSLSRIMDTDMALEMSKMTQEGVKMQASMAIMAQANQRPQQILQLLG